MSETIEGLKERLDEFMQRDDMRDLYTLYDLDVQDGWVIVTIEAHTLNTRSFAMTTMYSEGNFPNFRVREYGGGEFEFRGTRAHPYNNGYGYAIMLEVQTKSPVDTDSKQSE